MRTLVRILTLGAALSWVAGAAAEPFEGVLQMAISTATVKSDATGFMKGLHFKVVPTQAVQLEGGIEGYPLINFETKKLTIVATKEKYYLDLPLAQLEGPIDKVTAKYQKSGKTDTLQGHPVEEWVLNDAAGGLTINLWATKDYSAAFNFLVSLQKTAPKEGVLLGRMGKDLIAQGWFPLKAEARDAKGNLTLQMAITGLTPKKLDDKEFAIPDGIGKMADVLKKKKGSNP